MATQPKRKPTGWAIRDDGMLYPAYDSVLRQQGYRPYHGDVNASLEDRMRYLQGFAEGRQAKVDAEQGVFNIATADKDALIDFMLDEYAHQLDGRLTIEKLRSQAVLFIQVKQAEDAGIKPESDLYEAGGAAPPVVAAKARKAGIAA